MPHRVPPADIDTLPIATRELHSDEYAAVAIAQAMESCPTTEKQLRIILGDAACEAAVRARNTIRWMACDHAIANGYGRVHVVDRRSQRHVVMWRAVTEEPHNA